MKTPFGLLLFVTAVLPVVAQPGRVLTPEMVKNYWVNTFPQPEKLDRDYHQKKQQYEDLVRTIRSGELDDEAAKAALQNNVSVHTAAGDPAKAAAASEELTRLEAAIAEKERLAALKELTEEVKRLRAAVDSLRSSGMIE
jgi:polyhydroxyalkanoate synthesis regulator phasin